MKAILNLDRHKTVSINDIYGATDWRVRKSIADEIHSLVKFEAIGQEIPRFNKPVEINFISGKSNHVLDCDNVFCKVYIDGLVHAGVIKDDNYKLVKQVSSRSVKASVDFLEIEIVESKLK